MENGLIWGVISGAGGIIIAIGGFMIAKLNNGTMLQKQVNELQSVMFTLKDEHHRCQMENADLKNELSSVYRRLNRLEEGTGLGPGEPKSGLLVADLKGRVRAYAPSLTPLTRYLPQEIIGRSIMQLIPEDIKPGAILAFDNFVSNPNRTTDSSKVIFSELLTKTGQRIKVAIHLDGWQVGQEGLINAIIRERTVEDVEKSAWNASEAKIANSDAFDEDEIRRRKGQETAQPKPFTGNP